MLYFQLMFVILFCEIAYSDGNHIPESIPIEFNFIFYEDNNFYCSIPNHGIDVFNIIINELDIINLSEKYNYGPAFMPKEIEDKALDLLGEDSSKIITAIIPEYSELNINFLKRELALQPSGDGGYSGFLRKLEIVPFENMKDIHQILDNQIFALRPVGICWTKSDDQLLALNNIYSNKLSMTKYGDDLNIFLNSTDNLKQIVEYYLDGIRKIYFGEFEKEDGTVQLFSFIYNKNNLIPLSFEISDTIIDNFLEIETNEFSNDVSLHDTCYWLMVIQETNIPILFTKSTVSIIYILNFDDNKPGWIMNSYYYRGP